jgi:hypothetical protein
LDWTYVKPLSPAITWGGLLLLLLVRTPNAWGQGGFDFNNRINNGSPIAAIYGPDPDNPGQQKWGNATNGVPAGGQVYLGQGLTGSSYTVEAWYTTNAQPNVFQLAPDARAVPDSQTHFLSGAGAGFFFGSSRLIPDPLPNSGSGFPYYAHLQVRAWDNADGQLPTWMDAWNAAQAGSGRPVGWSKVFYQPLVEQYFSGPWPGLFNFESFNIFTVPEPAAFSLLLLGGAGLWLLSRRRT